MLLVDSCTLYSYFSLQRTCRESYSQIRRVLYLTRFCVNQWEEDKYLILFHYWLIDGHFTHKYVSYVFETEDW
jgi:hypothetical protein